jgi:HK97 family phage prohead protease
MDGESREDVERRLIETEAVVERCMCEKTGKKKPVIRGYAALFNSDSQDLGGFVERISPGAFDEVMKRGTDVVALYNHDPMFLLGRESSGTLRLFVDERGLRYEIDPPESRADVVEAIERSDVRGSSFAFRVKGSGEAWSRTADGRQLREIRTIDGLFDVGPVLKPAYSATESFVSRRALDVVHTRAAATMYSQGAFVAWDGGVGQIEYVMEEGQLGEYLSEPMEAKPGDPIVLVRKYEFEEGYWEETDEFVAKMMSELVAASNVMGEVPAFIDSMPDERAVDLKPTAGMAAAAKRGLRLHEEGKSGDGLKPETVARANKIARRESLAEDHVKEMNAWFARHETASKSPGWDKAGEEKPGFVAWLLWGGTPAKNWSKRKSAAMERSVDEQAVEVRAEEMDAQPTAGSLSAANYALYEALNTIADTEGMWPQEGPDGSHYMKRSPFQGQGMMCSNCVFFNEGGSCDVVEGQIEEKGLCKLWIIPEEKLSMEDPISAIGEPDEEPRSAAARLKAKTLESLSRGHSR